MSPPALSVATAASVIVAGRHTGPAALHAWADADPLAPAVRDVLAGHPTRALSALTGLAADDRDEVTRARAAAWGGFAASLRANCAPGGTFGSGLDVTARAVHLWAHPAAPAATPPAAALERDVVGTLLPGLPMGRSSIGPGPVPRDPSAAMAPVLTDLDRVEAASQDPALVAFCRRTRAEVLRRAGRRTEAAAALEAARSTAAAGGDPVEVAACELLAGDLALAPWTHPDAADLLLVDGGLESSALPWSVESQEGDLTRVDAAAAEAAYERADALCRSDPASTGSLTSVLTLRRAGLARVAGDHAAAARLADVAASLAHAADDAWVAHTAAVHGLLARVAAGAPLGDADAAGAVGAWGATTGSYAFAAGLGRLLSRAGRGWLVRLGDPDRARECHRCARQLAAALDAPLARDQSLVDEAATLAAVGAHDAALLRYETALDDLVTRLDHDDAATWRRAVSLGLRVHTTRIGGDAPDELRRSAARLAVIAAREPAGTDGPVDASLRELATTSAAGAEVHAILAEGDQARDRGDTSRRDERYAAALAAAGAAGDDLAVAVTLGRLARVEEATTAYRRHEEDVRQRRAAAFAALRAELGDGPTVDL